MSLLRISLLMFTSLTIIFLIYIPLFLIIVFSFNDGMYLVLPFKGFTTKWYERLFQDQGFFQSILNSMVIGLATCGFSLAIGIPAAFAFTRLRKNELYSGFLLIPFIMPWLVIGVSALVFFNTLGIPLSALTVVLSHTIYSIPLVVLIVAARLISLNPNLEKASMDLGANLYQTFRNIVFPLIYPSVATSALITFLWSFDNFTITFFTIGTELTFPIWVWGSLRHPTYTPIITAASSIVILIGSVVVYFLESFRIRRGLGIV